MSSGATIGTDREVEPAVGESFVVMFEEQFASREHDATVPCPPHVVTDAGGMAGMAITFCAGVAQRMDTRRRVRARAASSNCARTSRIARDRECG